jgi:hypothetical protein
MLWYKHDGSCRAREKCKRNSWVFLWLIEYSTTSRVCIWQYIYIYIYNWPFYIAFIKYFEAMKCVRKCRKSLSSDIDTHVANFRPIRASIYLFCVSLDICISVDSCMNVYITKYVCEWRAHWKECWQLEDDLP